MALCAGRGHQGRQKDNSGRTGFGEVAMAMTETEEDPEMYAQMTKSEVRRAHRKTMRLKGVKLGCHRVVSAKETNRVKYKLTGTCMICHSISSLCRCDDRSSWIKIRVEAARVL